MNGWIKLHRKILEHYLFEETRTFSKFEAWVYLLIIANHKDKKTLIGNELIEVKTGQIITSEIKLMKRFKWSKTKLRAFLKLIQNEKMIEKNSDQKKTTLTILKYKDYQVSETTKKPQKDYEKTAKRLQKDTNKNVKKEKNVKNVKNINIKSTRVKLKNFTPDVLHCFNSCIKYFDDVLLPKNDSAKNKWLDTIEKLNRIDKLSFAEIEKIVSDARSDDFWKKNFLSVNKLRKKNPEGVLYWKVFSMKFKKKQTKGDEHLNITL